MELGTRLKRSVRSLDTVARTEMEDSVAHDSDADSSGVAKFGGDEYAILLDDIRHPTDAVRVASRLQEILITPCLVQGHELVPSVSIGISLSRGGYGEPTEMLRDAEIAMHRAKENGKAGCELSDKAMHAHAINRLAIETDWRRGIAQGELKVFYQPIVSLENARIVGFEALSRWQRSDKMVMPGEFIDVADETGITKIGINDV